MIVNASKALGKLILICLIQLMNGGFFQPQIEFNHTFVIQVFILLLYLIDYLLARVPPKNIE